MSQTYYAALPLSPSIERIILDAHYAQAEKADEARLGAAVFRHVLTVDPRLGWRDVLPALMRSRRMAREARDFADCPTPLWSAHQRTALTPEQDIARQAAYSADGETL